MTFLIIENNSIKNVIFICKKQKNYLHYIPVGIEYLYGK